MFGVGAWGSASLLLADIGVMLILAWTMLSLARAYFGDATRNLPDDAARDA